MLEDKLLIFKFKRGSSKALRCIYQKYRLYLLKIASALLQDISIAEDIVHDVFIRFAQSGETLKIDGSLKAYLRRCVINDIRNKLRSDNIRSYVELSEAGPIPSQQRKLDQWIMITEESIMIDNALGQLPLDQKEVIALHLYGGMTFREIAILQAVSIKTIQSRYRYGLDKLRLILDTEVVL